MDLNSTDKKDIPRYTLIHLYPRGQKTKVLNCRLPIGGRTSRGPRGPMSRALRSEVSQETLDEWTEPLESFVGRRVPQKNRLDNNFDSDKCVCVCVFFLRSLFASTKLEMINRQCKWLQKVLSKSRLGKKKFKTIFHFFFGICLELTTSVVC